MFFFYETIEFSTCFHALAHLSPFTSVYASLVFHCLNVSRGRITHLLKISASSTNLFVSIWLRSPPLTPINSNPNTFHLPLPPEDRKAVAKVIHSIDCSHVSPRQFDIYISGHLPVWENSRDWEEVQQWRPRLNILRKKISKSVNNNSVSLVHFSHTSDLARGIVAP